MKALKILLLGLGFTVLFGTIQTVGWHALSSQLLDLKWKLLPLLFVYPFIFAFDTWGWAFSFPKNLPSHVPFRELYLIRVVGETLNNVIPWAASLGGEPIKAELLRRRHGVPLAEGFASILIVHTTFWLSLNIFVIGAILATLKTLPLTPILRNSVLIFLIVLGLAALLLVIGLHLGIFRQVHAIGETFKWWGSDSEEKGQKFLSLDGEIKKFYTANFRRFLLSTAFNLLGWLTGVVEVYWIAHLLGWEVGWAEAWLFEALIQVLRIVTFFIPSSIGAQEAGIVLIFLQFGFEKSFGLAFAVIRRLREWVWMALGLLIWIFLEDKPSLKKN